MFLGGTSGKEATCQLGDMGLIPWLGRSPGGRHGNSLQYFCLKIPRRGLACCSPWGHKELDTTEWLKNNNNINEDIIRKLMNC